MIQPEEIAMTDVTSTRKTAAVFTTYRVTVETPRGAFTLDVPTSQGANAAERRAHMSFVAARYGDLDEVRVIGTALVCMWYAHCENEATVFLDHPVIGAVPACFDCAARSCS
jgi:hypothetical protein